MPTKYFSFTGDGWFPGASPDGQTIAFGGGGAHPAYVKVRTPDGQVHQMPVVDAREGRLLDNRIVTFVKPIDNVIAERYTWDSHTPDVPPVLSADDEKLDATNSFDADAEHWVGSEDQEAGTAKHGRLVIDGKVFGYGYGAAYTRGGWVVAPNWTDPNHPTIDVWRVEGTRSYSWPMHPAFNRYTVSDQGWVGFGYWGIPYVLAPNGAVVDVSHGWRSANGQPWPEGPPRLTHLPNGDIVAWTFTQRPDDGADFFFGRHLAFPIVPRKPGRVISGGGDWFDVRYANAAHYLVASNVGNCDAYSVADSEPLAELPELQADMPFSIDPHGVITDVADRIKRSCGIIQGDVGFQHKGDAKDWGAWLKFDGLSRWIGLWADGSGADDGKSDKTWMSPCCPWFPFEIGGATDPRWALYNADFDWENPSLPNTNENVFVSWWVGYGRRMGRVVTMCHAFHSLKPDPHNQKRLMGYLEFDFYDENGNVWWENWHQDDEGNWVLIQVAQPYPVVPVTEGFPAVPRPARFMSDAIVTAPKITIRDGYGVTSGRGWAARAQIQGVITKIVWRWRRHDIRGPWTHHDIVPAIVPVHPPGQRALDMLGFSSVFPAPGVYEIGVDCWGPMGHDGTSHQRLIEVQ